MLINYLAQLSRASEKGQDAAEYALLISLIATVIIGAVTLFGSNLAAFYSWIVSIYPM